MPTKSRPTPRTTPARRTTPQEDNTMTTATQDAPDTATTRTPRKRLTMEDVGPIGDFKPADKLPAIQRREPTPFDDAVKHTFDASEPLELEVRDYEAAVAMVRSAAAFHGIGVKVREDKRTDAQGVVHTFIIFQGAPRRKKAPNGAKAAAEANA